MKANARQILPDIYNVGVIDWSIKVFHGYDTNYGTSYNSFLIMDDQPTLIDCVKAHFYQEYLNRVRQLVSLDAIKYIVVNHAEPDHSSALPLVLPYFQQVTIVCNAKCRLFLVKLYPLLENYEFLVIDGRSSLSIGQRTLKFAQMPMLHWPESMWTLSAFDKVIFTNDAFGQHIATCEQFSDQLPLSRVAHLVKEYIANILGPFPGPIQKALKLVREITEFTPEYMLTAHGLSWRGEHVKLVVDLYDEYSAEAMSHKRILILYDTIHGATYKAVRAFSDGVAECGFNYHIVNASIASFSALGLQAAECSGVCVCSPTVNSQCTPKISSALSYLRGLGVLKGKPACCIVFGGWNFKAVQEIVLWLETCRCEVYSKQGIVIKLRMQDPAEVIAAGKELCGKCQDL